MSRDIRKCTIIYAGMIICTTGRFLLTFLRTHLVGVLVAQRSCSSVPDAMREAKMETVEPLENMN